jgi:hypothetical protein
MMNTASRPRPMEKNRVSRWMTDQSTRPTCFLLVRKVRWWTMYSDAVGRGVEFAGHHPLGFADRITLVRHQGRDAALLALGQRQQRAGMAHLDIARHQHVLRRLGELQQAQQVGGRRARATDRIRGLLVGHREFVDQALDAGRFLERIEVFALDVLDQRHCQCRIVRNVADQHRHFGQTGDLRRAPAPLAGDDLEASRGYRAHRDRLDQPLGLYRGRQLLQRAGIHARARLVFARLQGGHRQRFLPLRFGSVVGRQQGVEAPAEALLFRWIHGFSFQVLTRAMSSTAKAR